MADIVIRGMEIPEPGQSILVAQNWDGSIYARLESNGNFCSLVPLPEGHGRLIDADKLTPDMGNYIIGGSGTVGSMCTMLGYSQQQIDNAPIILEAEVKEDG